MFDISAQGTTANLVASKTMPQGFLLTDWADDADPFDIPAIDIASTAMNANGDMVVWPSPVPIIITFNVIPNSPTDQNLAVIFDANRAAKNKASARDTLTISVVFPGGEALTLSEGKMTNGQPGTSPASAGRLKSKSYTFAFQNINKGR